MKKLFYLFSIVAFIGFVSCGGEDKKTEGKENVEAAAEKGHDMKEMEHEHAEGMEHGEEAETEHSCTDSCTKGTHKCGDHCGCGDGCSCAEGATCSESCDIKSADDDGHDHDHNEAGEEHKGHEEGDSHDDGHEHSH